MTAQTGYSADKMTAIFDDDGNLVQMIGDGKARVETRRRRGAYAFDGCTSRSSVCSPNEREERG